MLQEAIRFRNDFLSGERVPRWLSFVGTSGTGKTFLSEILYNIAKRSRLNQHRDLIHGVQKVWWPEIIRGLRNQKDWILDDLRDVNWLLVDEIAASFDNSGFAADALVQLASSRIGKWTMFTCNKGLQSIGDDIDTRIASRMTRDGSVVVEVNTIDFALR